MKKYNLVSSIFPTLKEAYMEIPKTHWNDYNILGKILLFIPITIFVYIFFTVYFIVSPVIDVLFLFIDWLSDKLKKVNILKLFMKKKK